MTESAQWRQTCPLCGGPNQCALAADSQEADCWCRDVKISEAALASIPPDSVGKRCLCPACGQVTGEHPDAR